MVCIHFMMALVSGATCRGWSTAFKILPSLLGPQCLSFPHTPDPTELLSSHYSSLWSLQSMCWSFSLESTLPLLVR